MKILIIGATGAAGSRLTDEALRRGHDVTAASRSTHRGRIARAHSTALDGSSAAQVTDLALEHDVVIGATRPAPGREDDIDAVTEGIGEGARRASRRLVVVGGAAPLRVPGTARSALEEPAWVPAKFRAIAAASSRQLEILRAMPDLDWTYLAPAAEFGPGTRTGSYRTGGVELVIDAEGRSMVSMEDFAIALLDEVESPTTSRGILSIGR